MGKNRQKQNVFDPIFIFWCTIDFILQNNYNEDKDKYMLPFYTDKIEGWKSRFSSLLGTRRLTS